MAPMPVPETIELPAYQVNTAPDNCVYRTLAGLLPRCLTPLGSFFSDTSGLGSSTKNDEMNMVLTDTERVYYAVGLSLCQLAASRAAVPRSCPAALKLTLPTGPKASLSDSNSKSMEKCLTALRASPQLWATYNGYYQTVGRICMEQAPLHQRERLLAAYTRVVAAHEQAAADLHAAMARSADDVWALVQAQAAERIGSLVAGLGREVTHVRLELEAVGEVAMRLRAAHAHVAADQHHVAHELGVLANQLRNLTNHALNASSAITANRAAEKYRYTSRIYTDGMLGFVVTVLAWAVRTVLPQPLVAMAATVAAMRSSTVMMVVFALIFLTNYISSSSSSSNSSSGTYNMLDRFGYLGRMGFTLVVVMKLTRVLTWGSRATSYQYRPQLNHLGSGSIHDDASTTREAGLRQPAPKVQQKASTAMLLQSLSTTAAAATPQQMYNRKLCQIYKTMC